MKVRFCEHNKGKGKAIRRLEEEFPGLDMKVKNCIGQCGPCHKSPFAVVEGKIVRGIDGDDLYRKIVHEMEHAKKGKPDEKRKADKH